MSVEMDMSRMEITLKKYAAELELSLPLVIRNQAGLLKADILAAMPPKNLARSRRQAEKDARKVFFPRPTDIFTGAQAKGKGMVWLYAANQPARVIVGVSNADYQLDMSNDQMRKLQYESGFRGRAYETIGRRGKKNPFKVVRVNRVMVQRGRFKQHVKMLKDSFGKLKASWAVDWERFNIGRALPGWVKRHIPNARGRTIDMTGNTQNPFVEMISNATGVTKQKAAASLRAAVKKRIGAMKADLRNQLNGAYKRAGFANAR